MNLDLEAPSHLFSSEGIQYSMTLQNNGNSEISPHHSYAAQPVHLRILTVTGWDLPCLILLLSSITALLWGTALCVFASGKVPVTWSLSQWGERHESIITFAVTIVATLATTHAKYLITKMVNQLAKFHLLNHFTLGDLEWMQGVREWDLFARFPTIRFKGLWVLLWVCMAVHTASVASIMRPVQHVQHVLYGDTVPCGVSSNDLTFNPIASLSPGNQTALEQSAFAIGLQLGTYYTALQWNTTTTVFSRPYVKENVSFGAIGGLHDGLQNVSGVLFDVQCVTGEYGLGELNSTWARTFPNRSFPIVSVDMSVAGAFITGSFTDPPVNTSLMQSVTSSTAFNVTASEMALYGLVNVNGGGGLLAVTVEGCIVCTWQAIPKLVHVIVVDWVARSDSVEDAAITPQYVGYGVLNTIKGMAYATLAGAMLDRDVAIGPLSAPDHPLPSIAEMLGVLLADGVKSTLTGFTAMTGEMLGVLLADGVKSTLTGFTAMTGTSVPQCTANVRTISVHWHFGNEYNLGWVAVVITIGVGVAGIVTVWRYGRVKHMTGFDALDPAMVFMLGLDSDIPQLPDKHIKDTALKIQDSDGIGRVIVK